MVENYRPKAGRVAVVTGAAQGLGKAFAERLASEGAIVVGVDRQEAPTLVAELRQKGAGDALYVQADLSDEGAIEDLVASVLSTYKKCDILINNVGISPRESLEDISLEKWRHVMSVNVESFFLTCRGFSPSMKSNEYGRIVNISSNTYGLMIDGFVHYIASKGAVIGLTRALASELGPYGITANSIAPGLTQTPNTVSMFTDTSMFDMQAQAQAIRRSAVPSDLVGAMSFLASDDAAFLTGQTLILDGGQLRAM